MQYHRQEPCTDLKKYISYYWYMENSENQEQQYPDLLIPDGYPEIIFILHGSYSKRPLSADSQITMVHSSSVIGIQNRSLLVKRVGKVKLFGIKFKPIGFYRLFGEKAVSVVDRTLSLNTFGTSYLLTLEEYLKNVDAWEDSIRSIERTLLAHVSKTPYSEKEDLAQQCIDEILDSKGNISLTQLSKKINKGHRQIQRYFKKYVGISPKKFSNLIRFKSVYKKNVLSDTALGHFFDYGYADQSHFIKDFKTHLGTTPSNTSAIKFKVQNEMAKKSIRP
ncbi:MAG: helix-turn-helix domain-containing protein [Bacteroidota bacterium]